MGVATKKEAGTPAGRVRFRGILPALASPLTDTGDVKEDTLRSLVRYMLPTGITGFYLCGATGEGVVMKPEARKTLAEIVVDEVGGKADVIDHIGAVDLRTAVDLALHAASAGVDAISSVPPFFYGYSEDEILSYYRALAEACSLPLLVYASPLVSAQITASLVSRLMVMPNVIGVKFTSYNYFEMRRIKELNGGDINVLNGPDETLLCGLAMGADGGIGTTYNLMPRVFVRIYESFRCGDMAAAQENQFKANRLIALILKYGVLASMKEMLSIMGFDAGYCTVPLKRLSAEESAGLRKELKSIRFEEEYLS
jgi:N-acetylneuraminate lyase